MEFTVVARRHLSLGEAHDLMDHIPQEIAATIPGAYVVVYAEPAVDCPDPGYCVHPAVTHGPVGLST